MFEKGRNIIHVTTQESLQEEEKHVVEALKHYGYPSTFICAASKALRSKEADQVVEVEEMDRTPLVVLPYVAGVSENIRQIWSRFSIREVFKFGQAFWLILTK